MKIAFFSDTWLPNKDGVVTTMINYRRELEAEGHSVFIFASADSKTIKQNADERVFLFRSLPFPPYPQYKIALFPFPAKNKALENKVELVHCHGIASMGLAALNTASDLKLPSVATFHTLIPSATRVITKSEMGQKIAAQVAWRAMAAFYSRFDAVTVPSHAIQRALAEHGVHSTIVPNAIDTVRFKPGLDGSAIRKKLGLARGEKMVLTTGRVSLEKNVDVLVRAARGVENSRFVIVGDGPARKELMRLAHSEGVIHKFIFTGLVSDAELPQYYAACDVFVTASTFETQGLALLEAMACGKPAVAADALALPEAVENGKNGFLFRPFSEAECAGKISAVLNADKKTYARMARTSRKVAEKYSLFESTRKLVAVYEKLLH
ncbi:MAG: glycosyltransferase [Candidatus Micrarchaeota archaeon]